MGRAKPSADTRTASDLLRAALEASAPGVRARAAAAGLARVAADDLDTKALLLRQLYVAHLERRELRRAADVARQMAEVGVLADIAHHDASRVLVALGEVEAAIAEQRLAARRAPASRRSFQLWSLGSLLHHLGRFDQALAAFRRAERWAVRDRPLVVAHAALTRLDAGVAVLGLREILEDLAESPNARGYGQYVLGMAYFATRDRRRARAHLTAFLRRNAKVDAAKALTLREELRRARVALAELDATP